MPIFGVAYEIADGESVYGDIDYVFAKTWEEAQEIWIKDMGLDDTTMFTCRSEDRDRWEEKAPGYRFYTIIGVDEASLYVAGLRQPLNLTALMHRPILPVYSETSDWMWKHGAEKQYWWYQGDIVLFMTIYRGGATVIGTFSYFQLENQKANMEMDHWVLCKDRPAVHNEYGTN